MSDWREPIIDRTAADVADVNPDSLEYQKGALNADDLNRIEGNYSILVGRIRQNLALSVEIEYRNFKEYSYGIDGIMESIYTDWNMQNIPYFSEIERIRRNCDSIQKRIFEDESSVTSHENVYLSYQEVNGWEKVAADVFAYLRNFEDMYVQCGTTNCGGGDLY